MKILKYIGFFILGLIALFLVAGLIIPKEYTLSQSVEINAPKAKIMDYIKVMKNQETYSAWILDDPGVKVAYKGTDGTVGAIQSWDGEVTGVGEQEIKALTDSRLDVELRFKEPFEATNAAANILESVDSTKTKVTSEFYGKDDYPLNVLSFIGKKMITEAEGKSLQNLKKIMEGK